MTALFVASSARIVKTTKIWSVLACIICAIILVADMRPSGVVARDGLAFVPRPPSCFGDTPSRGRSVGSKQTDRPLKHAHRGVNALVKVLFSQPLVNGEGGGGHHDDVDDAVSRNQLIHAMLRVPSVNATVDYWTKTRGANLHSYNKTSKSETAFVGFGPDGPEGGYFSLEITALPPDEPLSLGNAVQYFGLSMLLNFDINAGTTRSIPKSEEDPNGFEIRLVAAGPGDSFSRFCLLTRASQNGDDPLSRTSDFYVQLLGMKQVAADDTCICVRYSDNKKSDDNKDSSTSARVGVATTVVFVSNPQDDTEINFGNCFDHLAISTPNIEAAANAIRTSLSDDEDLNSVVFMEPKPMFGTKIMGLTDPNGYKVYLVERPES